VSRSEPAARGERRLASGPRSRGSSGLGFKPGEVNLRGYYGDAVLLRRDLAQYDALWARSGNVFRAPVRPTHRACLRKCGIKAVIPVKEDQKARRRRGRSGGRPPAFDAASHKQRNTVERAFNQLRQHRAVATRSSYVKA